MFSIHMLKYKRPWATVLRGGVADILTQNGGDVYEELRLQGSHALWYVHLSIADIYIYVLQVSDS